MGGGEGDTISISALVSIAVCEVCDVSRVFQRFSRLASMAGFFLMLGAIYVWQKVNRSTMPSPRLGFSAISLSI